MEIHLYGAAHSNPMSRSTPDPVAEDLDTKQVRLDNPSGFLYLTRHESVPIIVDALLDLPSNREFNKTELAEFAGVTRQTVGTYVDLLLELDLIEEVPGTAPQRYRLDEGDVVEALFEFNGALNAVRE